MIVLAMAMHYYALPKRSMTEVKTVDGKPFQTIMPSMIGHRKIGGKSFIYSFQMNYDNWPLQQTGFQIIPNGCVRKILVNGKEFPFRGGRGCNPATFSHWNPYVGPIYLDLAPLLKSGPNNVMVLSDKAEFNMGPVIIYNNLSLAKWLGLTMALVCSIALFRIMEIFTRGKISGYIVVVGFLVHLHRFTHHGMMERAMDIPGHLSFITFIATNLRWPNPYGGWSYYHPPLYYTIEAFIMRYANWLGTFDPMTLMQTFSFACFMVFLVFSALSLHQLIRNRIAYAVSLALLVFYPSGILFSAHIDSHLLFYACYAACLYCILRWLDDSRHLYFGIALILTGMGIASRSNALILLPLVGLAFLYNAGRGSVSMAMLRSNIIRIGIMLLVLGFAMNFGRILYYQITELRHEPWLVGNILRLSGGLRLSNDNLFATLIPNIPHYITHPLWSVWSDVDGRQHFWNSMLKSSLTGEYIWDRLRIALNMGNLLLAMIVFIIDAYILHRATLRERKEWAICMFGLLIPIAALFANRWFYPYGCSEDFRYIYPAIASFCGLMGLTLEAHMKDWRPFRSAVGITLGVAFAWHAIRFYT